MPEDVKLHRTLGFWSIVILTLVLTVGSGIFFLPVISLRIGGGMAILAWVFLSFVSILITCYFAELNSMYPSLGGVYDFAKHAYGKFFGFLIGWMEWIIGNLTTSLFIVSAMQYLLPFEAVTVFGITISSFVLKIVLSFLALFLFNYLAYTGIKTSARVLIVFGIVQISVVCLSVLLMLSGAQFSAEAYEPFFLGENFFQNFGLFFLLLFIISDTFFGMEAIFSLSEETKDPKQIPKAVILAQVLLSVMAIVLVISMMSFFGIGFFLETDTLATTAGFEFQDLSSSFFSYLGYVFFGTPGMYLLMILIFIGILGSAAEWIVSAPRLLYAMARDEVFIQQFNKIHEKRRTPYRAIIFQSFVMAVFVVVGLFRSGFETLVQILMPLVLIMICSVLSIVVYFRITDRHRERPYKAPFGRVGPILMIALIIAFLGFWLIIEPNSLKYLGLGLSFVAIGFPFYFFMVLTLNQKAIQFTTNFSSHFSSIIEPINLPRSIRKEILATVGDLNSSVVLDYGCGAGALTSEVIRQTEGDVEIIALDMSEKNLHAAKKRAIKIMPHPPVEFKHDPELNVRLNPEIKNADVVLSFGSLGYIKDLDKFLSQLYKVMPFSGRICFVEYSDLFGFIPNSPIFSNEEAIEQVFRKNGFSVRMLKKPGALWNYLFIYGFKSKFFSSGNVNVI